MATAPRRRQMRWAPVVVVLVGLAAPALAAPRAGGGGGLDDGVPPAEAWTVVQRGGSWLWARVRPGPRSPLFRPSPRAGWIWERARLERGRWVAGQWVPQGPPPAAGAVWVPGHWEARVWVDGRWREAERPGFVWTPGYVDAGGHWVHGRWLEQGRVVQVHAPVPELQPGTEPAVGEDEAGAGAAGLPSPELPRR